jgi:hypothetical protein
MIAVIRDPHCTGALTPSGAAPQVAGATAAAAGDELVLGHLRRHRQQIEHLPPLHPDVGCGCQVRAAARARTGLVPLPLVRVSDQRVSDQCQPRARIPPLPTRAPPALAPQRLRGGLDERRVRRRRLRGVPRAHAQAATQLGILSPRFLGVGTQLSELTPKLLEQPRLRDDQGGKLVI